jgi:hypothetical protein
MYFLIYLTSNKSFLGNFWQLGSKKVKRNYFQGKISKRRLEVRVKRENEIDIKEK